MRHFDRLVGECPKKEEKQALPAPQKPSSLLWHRFGLLADTIGFATKEIRILKQKNPDAEVVSRSAGCFGCYVTCPNAASSRVIHLVFHRLQHNCFSSLDSIKLVYQYPLERRSAVTDSYKPGS
jgi:hypothetical protein